MYRSQALDRIRSRAFAVTRGLQRLAIALGVTALLPACAVIPFWETSYDGVPPGMVRKATSRPELVARVGAPDAATADGRFVLYRFDTEREWGVLWLDTVYSDEYSFAKGHKRLDILIEFDANNLVKDRTRQGCAETTRETPCNASNEDALWALIERQERHRTGSGHRESQAAIATLIEPLHTAARNGDAAVVSELLKRGASPHSEIEGEKPLHVAAAHGETGVMETLVSAGAGIDVRGPSGETPLFMAAASGQAEAVAWLIEHGANASVGDLLGQTPLQVAASNGHAAALDRLRTATRAREVE